jgi:hypothetical protein
MGYELQKDGTIIKVNRRTRMKKPKKKRAHLLVVNKQPEVPTVTPTQGIGAGHGASL